MRARPTVVRLLAPLALLAALLLPAAAAAQVIRAFTPRYTTNDNGEITLIGNTLMTCNGNGNQCNQGRNGLGNSINNNDVTMTYVDADADGTTFSSSSAALAIPGGATVLWAGLYWSGDSNNGQRNQCVLQTPVAAYTALTATQLDLSGTVYKAFIDVTARVQAGGAGTYWVANVRSTNNASNVFAGWAMVVVLRVPADPSRNLVVFDGYASVAPGATVNVAVSGFVTPPAGPVQTQLGAVVSEGDLGFVGDAFSLNGTALSDAANPATNFFNSSVSRLGATVTTKTPNYLNQYGWDVDLVSANGVLPNNATSATITLSSTDDQFYPGVVTFATDLYAPVLSGSSFLKTVSDVNGGSVRPGDVLQYTLALRNSGNDGATATVVRDTLPANATYVAGSLQIVSGANAGGKTDAAGDDQGEYDAANRRVIVRLGTGATALAGGSLAPGVATSARFRVTVTPPAPTGSIVSNQAAANFNAALAGTPLSSQSDGDSLTAGIQRTNVTVTSARIIGTVFEDVNYGGGAGRNRASAAGVGRPGVRVETYDAAGAFVDADSTDVAGQYVVDGWPAGAYTVRVVDGSVTSSRPGSVATLVPVQTFRATAPAGTAVDDPDRVGGENPTLIDAAANTTAQALGTLTTATTTAQSVASVGVGAADVTGIDFGFNYDVVVSTRDAGQGSLRQFILNANTLGNAGLAVSGLTAGVEHALFMVSDGLAHPGLRAGLPSGLTGGVARITPSTPLPAITGASTRIDGALQTARIGDTNPGVLGAGGTVGVDNLALPVVARPEVEIRDLNALAVGVSVQASSVALAGLSILGFGNAPASATDANVLIGATATGALIENCVLGAAATSFTDPGAAARSGGDNLRALGGDGGVLQSSLVGFAIGSGVSLQSGSDGWLVLGLEIRGNAIGQGGRDGVEIGTSGTTTVRGSLITLHDGAGIDGRTSTGSLTLENDTVTRNGLGAAAGTLTPGIRLGGAGHRVDRDVITDNYGPGVLAASVTTTTTITRNSISGNGTITNNGGAAATAQIGIDLLALGQDETRGTAPFVTLNDAGDADAGANGLLNFPVLEGAVVANGNFTLTGWARPGSTIEVFVAAADPSGFGEGRTFAASLVEGSAADLDGSSSAYAGAINGIVQGADNTHRFRFTIGAPGGVTPGVRLTATATVASATSEFSGLVTVTTGVSVRGFAYDDANHNLLRDAAEAGTGATLYAKLIASALPASAQAVVAAVPATGAYQFDFVSAGAYTIVLDDNANAADVTPTPPAGRLGTEAASGSRAVTVAAVDVNAQNFGLWFGARVDGRVFRDDGAGGGVANDGVMQAGETALAAVRVRATAAACGGAGCDSVLTDGAGAFALWVPGGAGGSTVTVSETNPSGWISTGGGAGTTGGAYTRATDAIAFTAANGTAYTGADFGDVPPNQLAPPGATSGPAGGVVFYRHTYVSGSAGSVSFSATQTPTPAVPGWSVDVVRDLDCDGVIEAGETAITGPLVVTASQSVCLVLRHTIPVGAASGATENVSLQATLAYTGAAPALSSAVAVVDVTTVLGSGTLDIVKAVDLPSARPGDVLTYTITYRNIGPAPLSSILVQDATPAFTVFVAANCSTLGAGITGCSLTAQPSVGGTGPVQWQLVGSLAPGGTGTVSFQVRVQ
jgi:uncharacterized repeat protein (TIGR01451 family)